MSEIAIRAEPSGPRPVVSVLVMTYDHERFIGQAMESVLGQEAPFEYEILVSEDRSTDRTREIVLDYQRRFPERIHLLLSERNVRSNEVVRRGLRAARGRYIALLDGDDYWTSPHKLARQAEYLERHPECTICFHNARVVDESGNDSGRLWTRSELPEISTLREIWMGNFIATCSVMYRSGVVREVPDWYVPMFPITDWPLHILHAEHGTIGYIDEVMGAYRGHVGGLYSGLSERKKLESTARFYDVMSRNLQGRHDEHIRRARTRYFYEWALEFAGRADLAMAERCLGWALRGWPARDAVPLRTLARLGLDLVRRRLGGAARAT